MTSQPWLEALDDFEARLGLAEAVLELADEPAGVPPFSPPTLAEPLPAELAPRAETLLDRCRTIEERLIGEQRRIRAELGRIPRIEAARESGSQLDLQA